MTTMHHAENDPIAREAKRAFMIHAGIYAAVMTGLAILNFSNNPERLWFVWPLAGWGLGVLAHGIQAFRLPEPMRERITHRLERREVREQRRAERRSDA